MKQLKTVIIEDDLEYCTELEQMLVRKGGCDIVFKASEEQKTKYWLHANCRMGSVRPGCLYCLLHRNFVANNAKKPRCRKFGLYY